MHRVVAKSTETRVQRAGTESAQYRRSQVTSNVDLGPVEEGRVLGGGEVDGRKR